MKFNLIQYLIMTIIYKLYFFEFIFKIIKTIKVLMFGVMPCYMMCKSWELMLPIKEQPITVIKFKEWSVGK